MSLRSEVAIIGGTLRVLWIVMVLLVAGVAAGCSRQETGWRHASEQNTVAAYEDYLRRFPAGGHSAEARDRILALREAEAWAVTSRVSAPEAWQRYLAAWPEGIHAAEARHELANFAPIAPAAPVQGHAAQLGAYSNEAAARTDLARLLRDHAPVLDGRNWQVITPVAGSPPLWRLRIGPLAEPAARELCATLRSRGVDCVPVSG
jgi:SPOR domain